MGNNNNKTIIGLFGFGAVGEGLHLVLQSAHNLNAEIKTICVKQKNKERSLPYEYFTVNSNDILNDPEINLVVELIDDADKAYEIVKKALLSGKSVVSGNKKMLAYHLDELIKIQKEYGVALLYDASACGSIPIIRNLEEYYNNDLLQSVTGILNGSSNYILTKIFNEGLGYDTALKQAQELGFAESDPISDVGGFDALYKLIIITIHSFGVIVNPDEVFNYGIQTLSDIDIKYAKEKGCNIKLVAQVLRLSKDEVTLFVLPKIVSPDKYIFNVDDEYNGVVIKGKFYDKQFMFGKGAGGTPTGSAVLSDIAARSHNYKYEYKKQAINNGIKYIKDTYLDIYLRYNKEEDFKLFAFDEIYESYKGKGVNYVTGRISLAKLIDLKPKLPELDVFIASIKNSYDQI